MWPLALLGIVTFLLSMLMVFQTRAMLRFRATGHVVPGSISDWEVVVWRFTSAVMGILALIITYMALFKL